jgi:hypothetical protein
MLAGGMIRVILFSLGLKWILAYWSRILGKDVIPFIRNKFLEGAVDLVEPRADLKTST